ncbi:multidrug resistance regulator 2 [Candida viswanathii]|uniref:Multidrug resistance regulator 2 n=1 Tax=Candida viswanathii TaxID=5486 RepID=A0A367YFB1_9ASCO|nr:multidrug resistance regulator 2 [Candida viswanathii]
MCITREYFEKSQVLASLSAEQKQQLISKAKFIRGQGYIPGLDEGYSIEQLKKLVGKNPSYVFAGSFADPLASYFSLIPPAWVNQKLLDGFFRYIYPLMPIVDETDFRNSLDKILGPVIDGQYINSFPNVLSGEDLPLLALFLLILRITYLHVPNISTYAVSFDAFRAAETIMKEFNVHKLLLWLRFKQKLPCVFTSSCRPRCTRQSWVTQLTVGSLVHSVTPLVYIGTRRTPKIPTPNRKLKAANLALVGTI